ncbi:MAG: hypothetical protein CMJ70_25980 [Planctomycetaceae bacterium]|nr:hypothetical protein [Planctomycetaceae bacterium]
MRNARSTRRWLWLTLALTHSLVTANEPQHPPGPLPIPDRLVVLSFDDGNKSDITYVAPALQRLGFGATFFVSEGLGFGGPQRLSWDDVRQLDQMGFEIANHTISHPNLLLIPPQQVRPQIADFTEHCLQQRVTRPVSFAYPGGHHDRHAVRVLGDLNYQFARRGTDPEAPLIDMGGRGSAYDPRRDHPLLVPSTLVIGPNTDLADLAWAVGQATAGKIAVLTMHGVPDVYPHCSTTQQKFDEIVRYLKDQRCTVIALRDVARYLGPAPPPEDPYGPIFARLGITADNLRCEYLVNPHALETRQPRFSWQLHSSRRGQRQAAYQILVASSPELLRQNQGDLWDSGQVRSDQNQQVTYRGKPLTAGHHYVWKVRVWNHPGDDGRYAVKAYNDPATLAALRVERVSPYSPSASFGIGIVDPQPTPDQHQETGDVKWQAQWIAAADPAISAPLLRQEITLQQPVKRVTAYAAGVGYFELYINGHKAGDHVLDPGTTYYHHDQDFPLRSRVLYVAHDVTHLWQAATNAVGIVLGNGWYSAESDIPGSPHHRQPYADRPCVRLQLEIEFNDGSKQRIGTDANWKTSAGPITYNDYSHGETYDARREQPGWQQTGFDATSWDYAVTTEGPDGRLVPQMMEPIRVVETLQPIRVLSPKPGVRVYDMGRMLSGWTRIRLRGKRGTRVRLRHGGRVFADDTLDTRSNTHPTHVARQTDTYILKGDGEETWQPRFTLHGFRYVEVTAHPSTPEILLVEGQSVHSAVRSSGSFRCSHPLLNRIHDTVRRTFACCLQSMPQDAMDRAERVAWLGDPGMVAEDIIYNFQTAAFWRKWLDDLRDAQRPDGALPFVCPIHWRNDFSPYNLLPVWQSTYPLFVRAVYRYYGDRRVLAEHFSGMKKLVAYLESQAQDHIIRSGLGDHMEPQADGTSSSGPVRTPAALTSTAYFYEDVRIVAEAAQVLGKRDEALHYTTLAETIRAAFNRAFFDLQTNQYATGSQTANALALELDLVPPAHRAAVLANLVESIQVRGAGHLATGIVGTNALEQVLPAQGRSDVMFRIATQTTFPSWGHQVLQGATTLWESWEDPSERQFSLNMKMLGSSQKFLYHDLAGIRAAAPGFREIAIAPQLVAGLDWVEGSVKTGYGPIAASWRRVEKGLDLRITIPTNTRATLTLPTLGLEDFRLTESGVTLWEDGAYQPGIAGITEGRTADQALEFVAGGGRYLFRLRGP